MRFFESGLNAVVKSRRDKYYLRRRFFVERRKKKKRPHNTRHYRVATAILLLHVRDGLVKKEKHPEAGWYTTTTSPEKNREKIALESEENNRTLDGTPRSARGQWCCGGGGGRTGARADGRANARAHGPYRAAVVRTTHQFRAPPSDS